MPCAATREKAQDRSFGKNIRNFFTQTLHLMDAQA